MISLRGARLLAALAIWASLAGGPLGARCGAPVAKLNTSEIAVANAAANRAASPAVAAAAAATSPKSSARAQINYLNEQRDDYYRPARAGPREPQDDNEQRRDKSPKRAGRRAPEPRGPPEFSAPIGNVSAVLGRDVRLVCTVENLGQHQVAWLKEETKTILSIDTNIIITNYRIFLIPDEEGRKWVLHIKDVQESDRGFYQCQVNTNPARSTSGFLEVVVPPAIIESETTQLVETTEGANASLQCKASGHPRPQVSWRREDGEPIRLAGAGRPGRADAGPRSGPAAAAAAARADQASGTHLSDVRSDRLHFSQIDRSMAGLYVCTASNGVSGQVSRQIPLYVKFPPKVSLGDRSTLAVGLGEQLEIDCLIEAFPKPTSYWSERQVPRAVAPLASAPWAAQRRAVAAAAAAAGFASPWPRSLTGRQAAPAQEVRELADEDADELEAESGAGRGTAPEDANEAAPEPPALATSSQAATDELSSPPPPPPATQPDAASGAGIVTVKQTALNAYTYRLRITVARMRPVDFGEYVCRSSNSMGSASARVLVKRAERRAPQATTGASTSLLSRPLSLTEPLSGSGGTAAVAESPSDYQRDTAGMGGDQLAAPPGGAGQHQFILASKAAHKFAPAAAQSAGAQAPPSSSSPRRLAVAVARQPARVYDENYLQAIRSRQAASHLSAASSGHAGAGNGASATRAHAAWLLCALLVGLSRALLAALRDR